MNISAVLFENFLKVFNKMCLNKHKNYQLKKSWKIDFGYYLHGQFNTWQSTFKCFQLFKKINEQQHVADAVLCGSLTTFGKSTCDPSNLSLQKKFAWKTKLDIICYPNTQLTVFNLFCDLYYTVKSSYRYISAFIKIYTIARSYFIMRILLI